MQILPSIKEFLLDNDPWDRSSHYASDITSCRRQLYYKWMDVEKSNPPTAGGRFKMKMGNKVEEVVHDWLKWSVEKKEITIFTREVSYRAKPEPLDNPIGMRLDFIFSTGADTYGIEVKSKYGRGIVEIEKSGIPDDNNLAQVATYLEFTPITKVILIYFGRDNGYMTEFFVEKKSKNVFLLNGEEVYIDMDHYISRLRDVEDALELDEIPDRDFLVAIKNGEIKKKFQHNKVDYKTDWQCSYCDWKDKCWHEIVRSYTYENNSDMFGKQEVV